MNKFKKRDTTKKAVHRRTVVGEDGPFTVVFGPENAKIFDEMRGSIPREVGNAIARG